MSTVCQVAQRQMNLGLIYGLWSTHTAGPFFVLAGNCFLKKKKKMLDAGKTEISSAAPQCPPGLLFLV